MPFAKTKLSKDRVQFEESLTRREVKALVADKDLRVLQCSKPVKPDTFELLNNKFFTRRPEVALRVYGFYSLVCDLSFLSRMTNLRHFSADCIIEAKGLEHIAAIEGLESLGVGIYHLEEFEFLAQVTQQLKKLYLGRTKSKKPDLSSLSRFNSLEEIYIEGQQKNIEVLSTLENIQDVTLRSISTSDINYIRNLHRLWSLDIKLGGIKDISAIKGMENIKYLELWQIRGLSDISVISSLTGLQYLFLQSLRRVTTLPAFDRLDKLRRIYLENMNGLEDISSLEYAPALKEFIHLSTQDMQPEKYVPLLRNPNIKGVATVFGSDKRNTQFNELMQEYNVEPLPGLEEFEFI